jgi:hypothetical protein
MKAAGLGDPTRPRPESSIGGNLKDIAMKPSLRPGTLMRPISGLPRTRFMTR